jgi:hypothetical protein
MCALFDRKDDYGYIRWAQDVKRRDNYACVICNRKGVALNSHHLNAWASFPAERYDVQNGATLCLSCHDKFHEIYNKGKNTVAQFKEFEQIMGVIIKLANTECLINCTARKMLQQAEKDQAIQFILQDLEDKHGHQDGYT